MNIPDRETLWTGGTLLAASPVLWRIGKDILSGKFSTDLIAAVSILTAIATRQNTVALIIVAMYLGGEILESFAMRRASASPPFTGRLYHIERR